ncbi:GAF domain-containing protein [Hymenobacter elongatus]|uniref:GAF domain-containing protein n=1 Tax=Hymenobacter elongatus TaxID=877208 RepID=A0A4Z0PMZ9_9BACT|nr:GAF domain-containing protein [Hymenobacter elongatus]TGE17211.1 GAF domain-containing protein [Hymenobacter elongatus]
MPTPDFLLPANESLRLQALAPYRVLGTAPDAVFDEVARLTAKLFDVPIALLSFVDEDSVWFKANFGLAGAEHVPRTEHVCAVAILKDELLIHEDLLREPCKLTKPGVAADLQLRFHACQPLRTETGYSIGALCIIDREARTLTDEEQTRLHSLTDVVMKMLDLRLRLALDRPLAEASATWLRLYLRLDESLTRLGTLAELARWETPGTPAALSYRKSLDEEANLVVQLLDVQTTAALATLR